MLISELIDSVRLRLMDTADQAYDDTIMLNFYNSAVKTYCQLVEPLKFSESVTVSGMSYNLNSLAYDFIRVESVYACSQYLALCKIEHMKSHFTDEDVHAYAIWGDTLYFDNAVGNAIVKYSYIPDAAESTSVDVCFDSKHLPAIEAYIEYRCRSMDMDSALAQAALQEFELLTKNASTITVVQNEGMK